MKAITSNIFQKVVKIENDGYATAFTMENSKGEQFNNGQALFF